MQRVGGRLHGLFWELMIYYDANVDIKVGVRAEDVEARMVQITKDLIRLGQWVWILF